MAVSNFEFLPPSGPTAGLSEFEKACRFLRVGMNTEYKGEVSKWNNRMDEWAIRLQTTEYVFAVPFFTGLGNRKKGLPVSPKLSTILECLLSDASSAEDSFEDWCSNFGYDADSREHAKTYRSCKRIAKCLTRLLGAAEVERLQQCER